MTNPHFESVKEFMNTFGQEVLSVPTLPTPKVGLLRYNLIEEEADELAEAMLDDDLVETADALADLLYVIYGAYAAMGIAPATITTNDGPWENIPALTLPNITESIKVNRDLQEDLHSMMEGYKAGDLYAITHAMNGMLYTIYKFSFDRGIDIYACFDEVHGSNLSKACKTEEEAVNSLNFRYHDEGKEDYRDAWVDEVNGFYVIKRNTDNKALKGNFYYDPDLAKILGL